MVRSQFSFVYPVLNVWRNGNLTRLPPVTQSEPSAYTKSLSGLTETVLPTTSTTSFFADFASTYFHPRSLIPITPPYPSISQPSAMEITAFSTSSSAQTANFEAGADLFDARDVEVDVLDTDTRHWLEECDSLQAVQVFTSSDDAWAGFASRYVERLRDELGKGCIWVWGIDESAVANEPGSERRSRNQRREQTMNTALAVHGLAEQASMFVPLTIPERLPKNISLDRRSLWHNSAFLESAIESCTLPTRLRESDGTGYTLRDWQDILSAGGRRTIAQLSFDPDFDVPSETGDARMRPLDAEVHEETGSRSQSMIRIAPSSKPKGSSRMTARNHREKSFSKIESFRGPQERLDKVLASFVSPTRGNPFETYCVPLAFPLAPTFPQIFQDSSRTSVGALSAHTMLETSSEVAKWVRSLQANLRFRIGSSVGGQEREAVFNELGDIAEKYIEDWESGDESEDDE